MQLDMSSSQPDTIQPSLPTPTQDTKQPSHIQAVPSSPVPSPKLPDWLKRSDAEENSVTVPPYNPIKVGTQVGINYAAYHLPPWCYFRGRWEDLGDLGNDDCNAKLKHTNHPNRDVTVKGMGEGGIFLSRTHEFQGVSCSYHSGVNEYKYRRYEENVAHHVDTWAKFASDDNEELLPPTMNENWFKELKENFGQLLKDCDKQDQIGSKPLAELSELEFDDKFHELESSLPSEKVYDLLRDMAVFRRRQEQVLIQEIHRRIDAILKPEAESFRSVLERKVEHDREVDRLVRSLFAHKMRIDVRVNEVENIEIFLGLREEVDNNDLSDILKSLAAKIETDLEKKGVSDTEDVKKEIEELKEYYLKTEPDITPVDSEFGESIAKLKGPYEYFKGLRTKLQTEVFDKHETGKLDQLKDTLMDNPAGDNSNSSLVGKYLDFLREVDINELQDREEKIVSIRKEVDDVMRRVKRVANEVQQRVDKHLKEEKPDPKHSPPKQILSFKSKSLDSPFSVDDLNLYLRYPPIRNRLVYHEGNWPPLRAVPSETTVSVKRMDSEKKDLYENVKLSNVIGRFDEAFTLFSSTLADHGMPRPTPRTRPIRFRYGMGEVVPALDHATKGISDMKLGEIRIMVCPSRTCYGERGVPDSVPPHMPLVYVVRMNGIYNREDENYESDDEIPLYQSGSEDGDVTV